MPPDPVTALARKWCDLCGHTETQDTACPICIAAAVREALEMAETVCENHMDHGDKACLAAVKRDIAALRRGTG